MQRRRLVAALCALACGGAPSIAHAGGLYFTDRGVRPMGRAGAFVAGADDLGATWYNPAGLADAGTSVLVDLADLDFSVNYTRRLAIQNPDGTLQQTSSPTVQGSTPFLPIPTVAWSYALDGKHRWTVASGVLAPYVALTGFPSTVNGQPSPARYAMGSFAGSLMAIPGVWLAWKPIPEIRIGAGFLALAGSFQTTVTFNASPPDRILAPPEDPSYDAAAKLSAGPIFAPTANAGVTFVPSDAVRVGISGQGPMVVDAPAQLQMRLPSAPIFAGASQDGTSAHIHFVLPAIFRAGIEVRPLPGLRVEAAYVREFWSSQQSIDVTIKNISLDNVGGGALPAKVPIPNIVFPRGFQDSNSYRLGAEYHFEVDRQPLDVRAGVSYETSGVPSDYVSISSLDFDKITPTVGGSVYVSRNWRFDLLYAHVFASTTYVDPTTAKIPRINPIAGNPSFEAVNGGTYSASAELFGVGVNYRFE